MPLRLLSKPRTATRSAIGVTPAVRPAGAAVRGRLAVAVAFVARALAAGDRHADGAERRHDREARHLYSGIQGS